LLPSRARELSPKFLVADFLNLNFPAMRAITLRPDLPQAALLAASKTQNPEK
jgi:hypothetical protein